jgi:hypothetical protein
MAGLMHRDSDGSRGRAADGNVALLAFLLGAEATLNPLPSAILLSCVPPRYEYSRMHACLATNIGWRLWPG